MKNRNQPVVQWMSSLLVMALGMPTTAMSNESQAIREAQNKKLVRKKEDTQMGAGSSAGGDAQDARLEEGRNAAIKIVENIKALPNLHSGYSIELLKEYSDARPLMLFGLKNFRTTFDFEAAPRTAMRDGRRVPVPSTVDPVTLDVTIHKETVKHYQTEDFTRLMLTESLHVAGFKDERYRDIGKIVAALVSGESQDSLPTGGSFNSLLDTVETSIHTTAKKQLASIIRQRSEQQDRIEAWRKNNTSADGVLTIDLGPIARLKKLEGSVTKTSGAGSHQSFNGNTLLFWEDNTAYQEAYVNALKYSLDGSGLMVASVGFKSDIASKISEESSLAKNHILGSSSYSSQTINEEAKVQAFAFITPDPNAEIKIGERAFRSTTYISAMRQLSEIYQNYAESLRKQFEEDLANKDPKDVSVAEYRERIQKMITDSEFNFELKIFENKEGVKKWFEKNGVDLLTDSIATYHQAEVKNTKSKLEAERDIEINNMATQVEIYLARFKANLGIKP